MVRYLVFPELFGQRLDLAVAALSGLARREVRRLAAGGQIWLNGAAARVLSRSVTTGDVVDLIPPAGPLRPPASPPSVPLLHEDGWLVAVNKPAGVTSQPPRQRRQGELSVHEILALQLAHRHGRRRDVLLIHRLDRLTTGVMVFALQHEASRALARAWHDATIDKRYLVVAVGTPPRRRFGVTAPIARDPARPDTFRVHRQGRPARTEVVLLAAAHGFSLLEVRPLTGRTHQVRVHLAHAGIPVAGDTRYGGGGGVPRPFLHAWRLSLPHPAHGTPLALAAPLPVDMLSFLAERGLPLPPPDPLPRR